MAAARLLAVCACCCLVWPSGGFSIDLVGPPGNQSHVLHLFPKGTPAPREVDAAFRYAYGYFNRRCRRGLLCSRVRAACWPSRVLQFRSRRVRALHEDRQRRHRQVRGPAARAAGPRGVCGRRRLKDSGAAYECAGGACGTAAGREEGRGLALPGARLLLQVRAGRAPLRPAGPDAGQQDHRSGRLPGALFRMGGRSCRRAPLAPRVGLWCQGGSVMKAGLRRVCPAWRGARRR